MLEISNLLAHMPVRYNGRYIIKGKKENMERLCVFSYTHHTLVDGPSIMYTDVTVHMALTKIQQAIRSSSAMKPGHSPPP
jgi:hypothetical protein